MGKITWEYDCYLKSELWAQKRTHMLELAGYECELCHASDCELHVHHLTYKHIFDEPPEDLQVLCRLCHEKHHPHMQKARIRGQKRRRTHEERIKRRIENHIAKYGVEPTIYYTKKGKPTLRVPKPKCTQCGKKELRKKKNRESGLCGPCTRKKHKADQFLKPKTRRRNRKPQVIFHTPKNTSRPMVAYPDQPKGPRQRSESELEALRAALCATGLSA